MIISVSTWFEINTQEALVQIPEFIKASEVDPGIWRTLTGNCWQSCKALEGNLWKAVWSICFCCMFVIKTKNGNIWINPAVGRIQHCIQGTSASLDHWGMKLIQSDVFYLENYKIHWCSMCFFKKHAKICPNVVELGDISEWCSHGIVQYQSEYPGLSITLVLLGFVLDLN